MAFRRVEQLIDEPIIVSTYEGRIESNDVEDGIRILDRLLNRIAGPAYLILDISNIQASTDEVLAFIDEQTHRPNAGSATPLLMLVGQNGHIRRYLDAMRFQMTSVQEVPIFDNVEDAIACACILHAQKQSAARAVFA